MRSHAVILETVAASELYRPVPKYFVKFPLSWRLVAEPLHSQAEGGSTDGREVSGEASLSSSSPVALRFKRVILCLDCKCTCRLPVLPPTDFSFDLHSEHAEVSR